MTTNIVWATDGSAHSDRAYEHATELARRDGSTLHAVHVVEKVAGRGGGGLDSHVNEPEIEEKVQAQCDAAAQAGLDVRLHMPAALAGEAAACIARVADEVGADLIVVGTRGHTSIVNALIGGVTQRLLHIAPCPILAIPPVRRGRHDAASDPATTVAG